MRSVSSPCKDASGDAGGGLHSDHPPLARLRVRAGAAPARAGAVDGARTAPQRPLGVPGVQGRVRAGRGALLHVRCARSKVQ